MEDQTQQEPASPEVRDRIRPSFDCQGLMTHLGAPLTRCRPPPPSSRHGPTPAAAPRPSTTAPDWASIPRPPAAPRQAPQALACSGSHRWSDGDMPVSWMPHSVLSKMPKALGTSVGRPSATALSQRISMGRHGGREISNHSPPTWVAAWHQEEDQIPSSQAVGGTGHRHMDRPHTSHSTGGSSHADTGRPKRVTSRRLPNTPARKKRSFTGPGPGGPLRMRGPARCAGGRPDTSRPWGVAVLAAVPPGAIADPMVMKQWLRSRTVGCCITR